MSSESIFSRSEPGGTGCPPMTLGTLGFSTGRLSAGGLTGEIGGQTTGPFATARASTAAANGPAEMKDGDGRRRMMR